MDGIWSQSPVEVSGQHALMHKLACRQRGMQATLRIVSQEEFAHCPLWVGERRLHRMDAEDQGLLVIPAPGIAAASGVVGKAR